MKKYIDEALLKGITKNNMTISTLKTICDYFDISLSDFLKDIPIAEFSNE